MTEGSWLRMFCPFKPSGEEGKKCPITGEGAASSSSLDASKSVAAEKIAGQTSGCPMNLSSLNQVAGSFSSSPSTHHEKRGARINKALLGSNCPFSAEKQKELAAKASMQSSHGDGKTADDQPYYQTTEINPRNMMPEMVNAPLPSDKVAFSRERETSSIPKTGEEETGGKWVYPSPQQFYNSLRRRGKVEEEDELDKDNAMNAIIFAHNVTNEETWRQILTWEKMHEDRCKSPTLLSFVGKSEEYSIGGHFSNMFRKRGAPFDRHDWTVDRCGLERVRYIIDYYDDEDAPNDLDIDLVTRPAPDSFRNVWDRFRRPFWLYQNPDVANEKSTLGSAGNNE